MIQLELGNRAEARRLLSEAVRINPHFSIQYAPRGAGHARHARRCRVIRAARRLLALLALVSLAVLWPAGAASAHPLGNFTVNLYSGIHVVPGEIRIDYVVDMAEIPTFQEMPSIDTDGDGDGLDGRGSGVGGGARPATGREPHADGRRRSGRARGALRRRASCATARAASRSSGSRGCSPPTSTVTGRIAYRDDNEADTIGWREITAVGEDGEAIEGSTVPAESVSDALLSYPQDLLSSPLHVTSMQASFAPGVSVGAASERAGAGRRGPARRRPGRVRLARGQPRDRAGPARVRARRGVRRVARAAARAREDADGGVHGRLGDEGAAGRRRRLGGRRDAHGVGPGPRAPGDHARADVPSGVALPLARAAVRAGRDRPRRLPDDRPAHRLVGGARPPRRTSTTTITGREHDHAHEHARPHATACRKACRSRRSAGCSRSPWPEASCRRRAR